MVHVNNLCGIEALLATCDIFQPELKGLVIDMNSSSYN